MIQLFAETEYSAPAGLSSWIECAFYLMAFVAAAAFAVRIIFPPKDKAMPQPFVVQEHDDYLPRREFESYVAKTDKELRHMREESIIGRRNLHKDIEKMTSEINDKVSGFAINITNSVGELRGEIRRMK